MPNNWWETTGQGGGDWWQETQPEAPKLPNSSPTFTPWWEQAYGSAQNYGEQRNAAQRYQQPSGPQGPEPTVAGVPGHGSVWWQSPSAQSPTTHGVTGQTMSMSANGYPIYTPQTGEVRNPLFTPWQQTPAFQRLNGTWVASGQGSGVGNMAQMPREDGYGEGGGNVGAARNVTGEYANNWVGYWQRVGDAGVKALNADGTVNEDWVALQQAAHYQANMYPTASMYGNQWNDQYDYPMYWQGQDQAGNEQGAANGYGGYGYTPKTYSYGRGGTSKKTAAWVNLMSWKI